MQRPRTALGVAGLVFAVVSAPPGSIWNGRTAGDPVRSAHISVVVNRSFCVSSGVIKHRTGEGIARFYFTLRNTRPRRGRVNVTPVLVYERTYRSPAYEYHARSDTIFGCGVLLNGHLAVPINYI